MDARATYEQGRDLRTREVAALDARSKTIATARLLLAAGAIALVGAVVWAHLGAAAWAALAVDAALFVALVFVHAAVHDAKERASAALRFHERGLARIDHGWDKLGGTSERFRVPDHPFAGDLDIFGHASLMQLVDATETRFGEERLAELLSMEEASGWPAAVGARQEAVRELVGRPAFREALAMAGGVLADQKPDPAPLLAWSEEKAELSSTLRVLGWVLPLATAAVLVAGSVTGAGVWVLTLVVIAQLVAGSAIATRLARTLAVASSRESAATRWRAMVARIEAEPFESPLLLGLQGKLTAGGRKASEELRALERVMGFVEARHNEVFRLLIGPLLMWDVHCAAALVRWRNR
ncbi:MAG TPA: hypothetical protein VIY73_01090, partial [Polyangiaceae bacterium]